MFGIHIPSTHQILNEDEESEMEDSDRPETQTSDEPSPQELRFYVDEAGNEIPIQSEAVGPELGQGQTTVGVMNPWKPTRFQFYEDMNLRNGKIGRNI